MGARSSTSACVRRMLRVNPGRRLSASSRSRFPVCHRWHACFGVSCSCGRSLDTPNSAGWGWGPPPSPFTLHPSQSQRTRQMVRASPTHKHLPPPWPNTRPDASRRAVRAGRCGSARGARLPRGGGAVRRTHRHGGAARAARARRRGGAPPRRGRNCLHASSGEEAGEGGSGLRGRSGAREVLSLSPGLRIGGRGPRGRRGGGARRLGLRGRRRRQLRGCRAQRLAAGGGGAGAAVPAAGRAQLHIN